MTFYQCWITLIIILHWQVDSSMAEENTGTWRYVISLITFAWNLSLIMPAKCTYFTIFDSFECQVDSVFYQTSAGTKWSSWFSRWTDNDLTAFKSNYHTILNWNMTSSCLLSVGKQAPPAVTALHLLFLHLCQPYASKISQAGCEICCFEFNQLVETKVDMGFFYLIINFLLQM